MSTKAARPCATSSRRLPGPPLRPRLLAEPHSAPRAEGECTLFAQQAVFLDSMLSMLKTPVHSPWRLGAWAARAAAGLWLATQAGCGLMAPAQPVAPEPRILELASGRWLSRAALLGQLQQADLVLLGEQHDNPVHHRLRGELLAELGPRATVVAEHLPSGRSLTGTGSTEPTALLADLQQAGFEPQAWDWPLHQPLFAPLRQAGIALYGGDIEAAVARRIAREGESAVPAALATLLSAAPLSSAAQARLDAELQQGHCGQLPAARLPAMRWAQRARDASLWQALAAQQAHGAHPAVLVAGNGHVQTDTGVPTLAAAWAPQAKLVTVVFVESQEKAGPLPSFLDPLGGRSEDAARAEAPARNSYAWITEAPERLQDPCEGWAASPLLQVQHAP